MTNKKEWKFLIALLTIAVILTIMQPMQASNIEEETLAKPTKITKTICEEEYNCIDLVCDVIKVFKIINVNEDEPQNEQPIENSIETQAIKFILHRVWDI